MLGVVEKVEADVAAKLADLVEFVKKNYSLARKERYEIESAKIILASRLRCGHLRPVEVTKEVLMYEQGFTEAEAVSILTHLQSLELI